MQPSWRLASIVIAREFRKECFHTPFRALHCTALHSTALYYTGLYCSALHCTALAELHCVLHCTAQCTVHQNDMCSAAKYFIGLYHTQCLELHCTLPHFTALHCTELYPILPQCTALHSEFGQLARKLHMTEGVTTTQDTKYSNSRLLTPLACHWLSRPFSRSS